MVKSTDNPYKVFDKNKSKAASRIANGIESPTAIVVIIRYYHEAKLSIPTTKHEAVLAIAAVCLKVIVHNFFV